MSTHGVASGTVALDAVGPAPPLLLATPRRVLRMRSDAALVERFRAGYEDAFGVLYERHRAGVLAVCIGVLGSRHDAEDAAQDAFAALAVALPSSPPRDLRAWLSRVARNAAIDVIRRRRAVTSANETIEGHDHVHGGSEVRAELESVFMGLRQLPESQRTALLMRELAGHSYQEIADLLALDEGAVRGLISRARIGLRAHREATEMPCAAAREALATELDGRRRDRTVRRHVRGCDSCKSYGHGLHKDARTLRSIVPVPAGGVASGGAIFGGFAVKTILTGGVVTQVTAACAVSVCAVGGIALLYPHSSASHHVHHAAAATVGARPGNGRGTSAAASSGAARARATTVSHAAVTSRSAGSSRLSGASSRPGAAPANAGKVVSSATVALHRRFQIPGSQNATGNPGTATGTSPTNGTTSAGPTSPSHPVNSAPATPGSSASGWSGRPVWLGGTYGWSHAGRGDGGTVGSGAGSSGGSGGSTGTGSGSSGSGSTGTGSGSSSTGSGSSSTGSGTASGSGSSGSGSTGTGSGSGSTGTGSTGTGSTSSSATSSGSTGPYGWARGSQAAGASQPSGASSRTPGTFLGSW
jgi:RNA polymerase sigma factor (sigma-70 family)